jgi:hypothetical protein
MNRLNWVGATLLAGLFGAAIPIAATYAAKTSTTPIESLALVKEHSKVGSGDNVAASERRERERESREREREGRSLQQHLRTLETVAMPAPELSLGLEGAFEAR